VRGDVIAMSDYDLEELDDDDFLKMIYDYSVSSQQMAEYQIEYDLMADMKSRGKTINIERAEFLQEMLVRGGRIWRTYF
jgi:hypothetical protein